MIVERLVIHHSASPRDTTTLEQIDAWHRERGFKRVGYHIVIEGEGRIRLGRPLYSLGAHVRDHNAGSVGICVVGDNTREKHIWGVDQEKALVGLVGTLRLLYGASLPVLRHCDLDSNTECPGLSDGAWARLRALWGDAEGGEA